MGWVVESPGALAPHVVEDGMDWGILFWALVQSLPQDSAAGSGWGCRGGGRRIKHSVCGIDFHASKKPLEPA